MTLHIRNRVQQTYLDVFLVHFQVGQGQLELHVVVGLHVLEDLVYSAWDDASAGWHNATIRLAAPAAAAAAPTLGARRRSVAIGAHGVRFARPSLKFSNSPPGPRQSVVVN